MDNNIGSDNGRLGGIFLIIAWLIIFALFGYFFQESLYKSKTPTFTETYGGTKITIYRDHDSHFRIDGSINGTPVTFLIDTGATTVAIPQRIAQQARLAKLAQMATQTAGGNSLGYFTRIDHLDIGKVELDNVSAIIIPDMQDNTALLGMNVLEKFDMQQTPDSMILTVPAHASPD